jgi:3-hydroxyacyl-[acyl-carrier-protein] dehydratase
MDPLPIRSPLNTALQSLPHGPEFRFLDRLTSLVPGQSGGGEYRVRGDESFLAGHFPGQPLFPGVLLLEAAAQLAGAIAQADPAVPPLRDLKLTAIRNAKILGTARPGETIHLQGQVLARLGPLIQAAITASIDHHCILQTELTLGGQAAEESTSAPRPTRF